VTETSINHPFDNHSLFTYSFVSSFHDDFFIDRDTENIINTSALDLSQDDIINQFKFCLSGFIPPPTLLQHSIFENGQDCDNPNNTSPL
jgi:hypothetical protein